MGRMLAAGEKTGRNCFDLRGISKSARGTFCEKAVDEVPGIEFEQGFITPLAMRKIGSDYADQLVFLAGPPMMVDDAIRQLVMELGCPVDAIRYDKFG